MSGYTTIPYVTAFAHELIAEPFRFERIERDLLRLTYRTPHPTDWVNGMLRARVQDLRDQPDRRGPERMGKLHTRRQWRAMDELLCQVCAEPAAHARTGRASWLLTEAVFRRTGYDSGHTATPPTCPGCVDDALKQCPALREGAALYTVAAASPAGVFADLYRPARDLMPILYGHNVFVPWHSAPAAHHRGGLATRQVVHLHGMKDGEPGSG